MFWTQTNQKWTDGDVNKISREINLKKGWRRQSDDLLGLLELLLGIHPLRAKQRLKPTWATLSLAFLPWPLLSHLPLSFSFLQSPPKGSEVVAALALSPVGEKCLCEAHLQAESIWFCQLVWHAMKYLGLELKRKVRTLHSYLEVLCLEMGMEGVIASMFSWKIGGQKKNSRAEPRKEEWRWGQGRSNSRKTQTGWRVPKERFRGKDADQPCDVAEREDSWHGGGFGTRGRAGYVSTMSGCRLWAVENEYALETVNEEELKTETVAWGINFKKG